MGTSAEARRALLAIKPVVDGQWIPVEVLVLLHHVDVVERR